MKHKSKAIQRLIQRLTSKAKRQNSPRVLADKMIRRLPSDHHKAAKALVDHQQINSLKYRKMAHRTSWDNAHPDIIDFHRALHKELRARSYPFYAFFFFRTHAQQNALYSRGVTKAKGGQSPHNYGCAVDEIHCSRLWNLTRKEWAVIGAIGKEVARRRNIKMDWGGDWNFYDPAHWQLSDWKRYKADIDRLGIEVTTVNLAALQRHFKECDRAKREKRDSPPHPFE
ncbi:MULTISPECIES: M15 family metallopeptidase [unclassified Phaeobacter]|uniref:M15 family metallopeptidase n=1 Tax=unclassified Phaeobacter TaxID=2621772 RepID=UPI003A8862FB